MGDARLFPLAASQQAGQTDTLYFLLIAFSAAITLLVVTLIVVFGIRYRRDATIHRGPLPDRLQHEIELGWTLTIGFLAIIIFFWAVLQDSSYLHPPKDALKIRVLAKQWMWKVDHPEGAREINTLHVPLGRPVMLLMESRDVIHSFYVPAFRVKQDVVPGTTQRLWFTAQRAGTYRLLCAEFCGAGHSAMTGEVVVMPQEEYARWIAARPAGQSLPGRGKGLFVSLGCAGCHSGDDRTRAPSLAGVYGRRVLLADGRTVEADERYLHDSILRPRDEIVAGYKPIMPSFEQALDEDEVLALVAYLKSLSNEGSPPR